ncbi:MAG: hypothetical protein QGH11_06650, partial [Pirellulaceae bacterium]|nr:hypothetical protein [Pirellulaceae bacterium]
MSRIALHWQVLIGMVLGSVVGLSLNWGWSVREVTVGQDDMPAGVLSLELVDTRDRVEIHYHDESGHHQLVVDPASRQPGVLQTLKQLEDKHPREFGWFKRLGRSRARWVGDLSQRLGNLFLRLLRMVAIPLIV